MANIEGVPVQEADVVVAGAGITGLGVAWRLQSAGLAVRVVEARDRVGGRLRTLEVEDEAGTGSAAVDLGATWFWPGESRVQVLVDELDLPVHRQHLAGDALYDDPRRIQRLSGNPIDVESFRFATGAQSLARRLADRLDPGTVRLEHAVRRVELDHDAALVTGTAPAGEGFRVRAAHVVLAVPPPLVVQSIEIAPDLPADLRRLATETPVWMGTTVKAVARYETAFWREQGLAGSAISHIGPLREIHDMSGPGGHPAALFGFAQGAVTADAVRGQLARLFGPEAGDPTELLLIDWSRERWTTPAGVASTQRHDLYGHPLYRRPVGGRLHFASTETAPAFAGHIEGALLAADEVAGRILAADPSD